MDQCATLMSLRSTQISDLKIATPSLMKSLNDAGFASIYDLISYYPRRYVDRTNQVTIMDAEIDCDVLILGTVSGITSRMRGRGREIVFVEFHDRSGTLQVTFFNQPWRKRQLIVGMECALFGKIALFGRRRQMVNPLVDLVGDRTGRIVPIYPHSDKFTFKSEQLPKVISKALLLMSEICDPLPVFYRSDLGLVTRDQAYRSIHLPQNPQDHLYARKRLAFDELLQMQLYLVASKAAYHLHALGISHLVGEWASKAYVTQKAQNELIAPKLELVGSVEDNQVHEKVAKPTRKKPPSRSVSFSQAVMNFSDDSEKTDLVGRFYAGLGFSPTDAQRRVIGEIALDMASKVPMHRLLQGDVGSGKTLVAVVSGLFAVQGRYQVAILAPTEVLAEQHYLNISKLCADLKISSDETFDLFGDSERSLQIALLTSKVQAAKRRAILADLAQGNINFLIGTHAVLSEGVKFHRLGLIVVDEQHRFGVEQRSILRERSKEQGGFDPDTLVMTATPIPRTAAMTIFGDLDYSVLDELPPGRTPIITRWARDQEQVRKTYIRVRNEVEAGRQAYVVCPLVEDSEKIQARSAVAAFEELGSNELLGLRLGLLHGQMPSTEKALVMERFRNRDIDVLVSTTVIEVGVDVKNATVMVIQDAGRFGISQIHQLRGRVGRGSQASYCYLIETAEIDSNTEQRLLACVESSDGFVLAERDLELRGEGTFFNSRQKGRSDLRVASLSRDKKAVLQAREVAKSIVGNDPTLSGYPSLKDELFTMLDEQEAAFLSRG